MNTSIEKIKAYHSIKCFLNNEQKHRVAEMLNLNDTDINTRLKGKDNEIEFVLMVHLLEWCKSIVGFEEGVSKLTDTVSSDFLVELHDDKRLVIEVKTTDKKSLKISDKIVYDKEKFANSLNAKLYFAIKINGNWILLDSEYIKNCKRKISLEKDYSNSIMNETFGERTFIFPKGLKITSIYEKKPKKHLVIQNDDYGYLVRYKMEYNGKKIFAVKSTEHPDYGMLFLYENLQDFMSIQYQDVRREGDKTVVVEELINESSMMYLSSFMMSPIKHLIDEAGYILDYHQFLINMIEGDTSFITRKQVLFSFQFLLSRGYEIYEKRAENIYNFKDMIIN